MTGYGDETLAVEIMKSGAVDYLVKSATMFEQLPDIARKALRFWENLNERMRAEKAEQDSRKRLADILAFLPDAVLAIDNNGTVIAWNNAIENLTGVPAEDMLGKGDHEYSIPFYGERRPILIDLVFEDDAEILKRYAYVQRDGDRITVEADVTTLKGSRQAYLWGTASPLYDNTGRRVGAIEVIRDITERKRAEETLQKREATLETLLNAPHDTIVLLDRLGTIIDINAEGAASLGKTINEVIGKCAYDILPKDIATVRKGHIDQVFEGREPVIFEDERAGRYLHNEIFPVFNQHRTSVEYVAIFSRDITGKKKTEQALLVSEDRFRHISSLISDFAYSCTRPDGGTFIINWITGAFLPITGYTEEEILAMGCWRCLIAEEDQPVFDEKIAGLLPGMSSRCELRLRSKDNTIRWLRCFTECSINPADPATHLLYGGCQDITDQKKMDQILQESERKYRFLIDNIHDIIWQTTPDLTFTYLSIAVENLTGYVPADLIGTSLFSILTEASARVVQERLSERMEEYAQGKRDLATVFEIEIKIRNGDIRWFEVSANAVFGPDGAISGFQGITRDISKRKKAEADLAASELRFKDLFNNMNAGVAVYEAAPDFSDFIIRDINKAVEHIEKVKKEEILGKSILEVFPGVTEFGLFSVMQRVAQTGNPESHPVSLYKDSRITGWRENYVYRLPTGEIVALYDDVTENKQAQERIRESEEKARILMNVPSIGAFIIDREGILLDVNDTIIKGFNRPAENLLGTSIYDLLSPEVARRRRDRVEEALRTKEMVRYEDENNNRYHDTVITPLTNSGGEVVRLAIVTFDITQVKKAQALLAESEKRYRTLIDHLPDYVIVHRNGILEYVNPAAAAMMGSDAEMLIGKPILQFIAPEDHETVRQATIQRMTGSAVTPYEIKILGKDGTPHTVFVNGAMIQYEGMPASLNVLTDITLLKQEEEIRNAYEIRLDSAMEIGSLAWWEMDLPEGTVRFDDRKATMLGYSPDQFHHYKDFTSLLHPEDFERAMQSMRDHLESRESRYHVDYRMRTAAGEYRWFRDVGGITKRDADGTPRTVTGIVIDITTARDAEEAVRATETRFHALIQNASDIIRIIDHDGCIRYESDSSERILGYPAGSLIGKKALEFIHPDDLEHVRHALQEVVDRTNTGTPTEFRIRKANGEYLWVDSIGTNMLDVPGVNGIVVTTRPIQQRKESEQALQRSEERLRLALEGADAGFWDWHLPSGNAVFSDRYYTMLGYEPGEFPATYEGWINLMHPDDRLRVIPSLEHQIGAGLPQLEIEYRILSKEGNWLWVLGRGKVVERDTEGHPLRLTGVNIDITNRRLMESEIRSLNTVLEQRVKDRTEALSKANDALEEENMQRLEAEKKMRVALEEKTVLLKEIHHRVKNNLQIIASLLNLQSRYIKDDATLAAIRESQNRVKAMALVHEKLYRAEDISHIDLRDYINFLGTGLFQFYDARSRGIKFSLDIQEVRVDINTAIPLGLVINELISNSLKYAFPQGKTGEVTISMKQEGQALTIIFQDNGIGIPADLDWQNTQSLGLRLVNTLTEQLNGTIELDRTSGTKFTLILQEKA